MATATGRTIPGGGGEREFLRRLLDGWLAHPDPSRVADAAAWARELGDGRALQQVWFDHLLEDGFRRVPAAVPAYLQLPDDLLRDHPVLAVAMAYAAAGADEGSGVHAQREVVRQALRLYPGWAAIADDDLAVLTGTVWMYAQRNLYGQGPDAALAAAWGVHEDVIARARARRAEGVVVDPFAMGLFHATSAQVALLRADLPAVITEAELALVHDQGGFSAQAARAVRAGALALGGDLADLPPADLPDDVDALRGFGLRGMALVSLSLAEVTGRLGALDAAGARAALARTADRPRGAPLWSWHAALQAVADLLWGRPEDALAGLDAAMARHSTASAEQGTPFGTIVLGRARAAVLTRLGGLVSARRAAGDLPDPWRALPLARADLHSGDTEAASLGADRGLFDPRTSIGDRLGLQAVKAAVAAMDDPGSERAQAEVAGALGRCAEAANALPLALLPLRARHDLAAVAGVGLGPAAAALRAQLTGLGDASDGSRGAGVLTPREREILPLLASAASVPAIAAGQHVSVNTLRKQVATLRAKFGARTREDLVRSAREAGLL